MTATLSVITPCAAAQPTLRLDGSSAFRKDDAHTALAALARASKLLPAAAADEPPAAKGDQTDPGQGNTPPLPAPTPTLPESLARLTIALINQGLDRGETGGPDVALALFIEQRLNAAVAAAESGRARPSTLEPAAAQVAALATDMSELTPEQIRARLRQALAPVAAELADPSTAEHPPLATREFSGIGLAGDVVLDLHTLRGEESLIETALHPLRFRPDWFDADTTDALRRAAGHAVAKAKNDDWSGFRALARWSDAARLESVQPRIRAALEAHRPGLRLWLERLAAGGAEPVYAEPLSSILADAASPIGLDSERELLRHARPLFRSLEPRLLAARTDAISQAARLYKNPTLTDPALLSALARLRELRADMALLLTVSEGLTDRERPTVAEARAGWTSPANALLEVARPLARGDEASSQASWNSARSLLAACRDALTIDRVIAELGPYVPADASAAAQGRLDAWIRALRGGKVPTPEPEREALAAAAGLMSLARDIARPPRQVRAWWAWPVGDALRQRGRSLLTKAVTDAAGRLNADAGAAARIIERARREDAAAILAAAVERRLPTVAEGEEPDEFLELCLLREPRDPWLRGESAVIAQCGWMWMESRGPRVITFGRLAREAADAALQRQPVAPSPTTNHK